MKVKELKEVMLSCNKMNCIPTPPISVRMVNFTQKYILKPHLFMSEGGTQILWCFGFSPCIWKRVCADVRNIECYVNQNLPNRTARFTLN